MFLAGPVLFSSASYADRGTSSGVFFEKRPLSFANSLFVVYIRYRIEEMSNVVEQMERIHADF